MQLYYFPGACSLAPHIALRETGQTFELKKVDIHAKRIEGGADYTQVNPKGYVPALKLASGAYVDEELRVLDLLSPAPRD